MKSIRLDKFLADMQLGTRSEVKQLLKKGLVTLNGESVKKPEIKVDPEHDRVFFDGKQLSLESEVYYMLNKPAGVVSATEDKKERTVLDLFNQNDRRPDLFPAGRLDKDTVGLLLITNDGALSHKLLSPRNHVDKTYFVRVEGAITEETIVAFEKGIDIGDEKITMPAVLEPVMTLSTGKAKSAGFDDCLKDAGFDGCPKDADFDAETKNAASVCHEALVTIREGRFHQIKRMFHAVGCEVIYLKRLSMGSLTLDPELPEGSYRRLTPDEIKELKLSRRP
ncbi:MAG: pseudouridine synthase [Lachnospiraceae bacterium]|nr:pseudouridine synthase [Lachnospiraceae bacterium]